MSTKPCSNGTRRPILSALTFHIWVSRAGFLPPIIFNSGYTLRRKVFIYYFVPIALFAVLGTFVSSIFVGLLLYGFGQAGASYKMSLAECLAFGSLISSTDPVSYTLTDSLSLSWLGILAAKTWEPGTGWGHLRMAVWICACRCPCSRYSTS
jgi:hypothetical protein